MLLLLIAFFVVTTAVLDTANYVIGYCWDDLLLQLKLDRILKRNTVLHLAALLGDEEAVREYLQEFPNEVHPGRI